MAGHGINQTADVIRQGVKDGEVKRHKAKAWFEVTEWSKTKRPPSKPRGERIARDITARIVIGVKRWLADKPKTNTQLIANWYEIGSGGRVTEIMQGKFDHLLKGDKK